MLSAIYDILTDKFVIGFIIFMIMLLLLRTYVFKSDEKYSISMICKLFLAYISSNLLINAVYTDGNDSSEDDSDENSDINEWVKKL